ncbi:hypothetical protein DVH24_010218 [Malus domestica]|uniref:Uncharacterized protein n=1 Tax=Malus domestica TaxID=3750 RepID=A0A498JVB8_MALDO|nr:hypothetical protein DVH24_010218 [Malus domestica]
MENKNSHVLLEEIRSKLLENLSRLQHAPNERPPDTELPEKSQISIPEERWDPNSDMELAFTKQSKEIDR